MTCFGSTLQAREMLDFLTTMTTENNKRFDRHERALTELNANHQKLAAVMTAGFAAVADRVVMAVVQLKAGVSPQQMLPAAPLQMPPAAPQQMVPVAMTQSGGGVPYFENDYLTAYADADGTWDTASLHNGNSMLEDTDRIRTPGPASPTTDHLIQ